ncbi:MULTISPECIES: hypothetical protein [Mesorhizobium]|uniref:hypothetical protein n=1 Tax=Mesorhizobium TaxID=68287 RepID=UPI0010114F8F|nr:MULTISPECIES: hypothetical protein [Mesorhizobium]
MEALALATAETLIDPEGGDATSRIEAYTARLAGTVRKGVEKLTVAAAPLRPSLSAPLVDHLRHWLAHDPPGKLRIVLKDQGDLGALLILSWLVEGMSTQYASHYYATRRDALESLNRDVLEPAGLAAIPYTRKLNWRLPKGGGKFSCRDKPVPEF